ncbi:translation elongation factor Ts [Mesomycoplasma ovipneumoniae]|uniref:Elongation factor Ts n=1 Tax=Mesomycoplasma ovipneumoniae TaxID=29562 RepID=A0AAJ2UCG1_9BACT|nr:translation elongation factor Ts [Mesomycoplasma ovipneumoniae]MDW2834640.1 translation elongation factor Ts [Mesomycoplasma ovipneumoniae]MDW2835396.1 translation elongation factor Ts [Mesomycoplasma ovipneumoniae]MDW2860748.1 translation elongation factor Ts [Mesomycoplasma ovipneumoniae]MDW2891552.1 translation elongation factor Ts [Mesomycoplasma ovipneumoniae]MDW2891701.1 translation elongation factor Ts [Mesomycoplasma ovipneumoniae]
MLKIDKLAKIKELREITDAPFVDCKTALENSDYEINGAIKWLHENGKSKALKKADRIAAEGLVLATKSEKHALIFELNSETDFVAKNQNFVKLQGEIAQLLLENDFDNLETALTIKNPDSRTIAEMLVESTATMGEKITLRRVLKTQILEGQKVGLYTHSNGQIASVVVLDGGNCTVAKDISMHVSALNPEFNFESDVTQERLAEITQKVEDSPALEKKPENIKQKIIRGMIEKELSNFVLEFQPLAIDSAITVGKYLEQNSAKLVQAVRFEVGEGIEKQAVDFYTEVNSQIKEAK